MFSRRWLKISRTTNSSFLVAFMLFCGCSASAQSTNATEQNWCFLVMDSNSGELIEGALVHCVVVIVGEGTIQHTCYTNDQGECCIEVAEDHGFSVVVGKGGYVGPVCQVLSKPPDNSSEFLLTPAAFLRVHLKNVEPCNQDDDIQVCYPGVMLKTRSGFRGSQVDTVVVFTIDPKTTEIEWVAEHLGKTRSGSEVGISVSPRDTFELEIEY